MEADQSRKSFLKYLIGGLVGFGAGATSIPFVKALAPDKDRAGSGKLIVDLSKIPEGERREVIVEAIDQPPHLAAFFIIHRTPEMISKARASNGGKDPQPDAERVIRPEWLIVSPVCTHLGCHIEIDTDMARIALAASEQEAFICPCHGSRFDHSGRVLRGPAMTNLRIPDVKFLSDTKIEISILPKY